MKRLLGAVYLLIMALVVVLAVAVYRKDFTPTAMVTLRTDHVGNQLHLDAEVKLRGVVVGAVRDVRTDGSGAEVSLAMRPDMIARVPAAVTARLLPKTLFGERYVDLVASPGKSSSRLAAGDVIQQDRSASAVEVEQVVGDLMPTLQAVQPQKLSSILSTLAGGLAGRGAALGQTLTWLGSDVDRFTPHLDEFTAGLRELAQVTDNYSKIAPDVVQALSDLTTTSRTIADQRANLAGLFQNLTTGSQDLATFLERNGANIIRLSQASVPTLNLLARYSPEYPCMLRALTAFEPEMDKVLGRGTGQPGMHVTVNVQPAKGKYLPGQDAPVYDDHGGPTCYPVTAAPNSAQENTFIGALTGRDMPSWGSVLVGPLYRGAEVTVG
ncbi:MCE family protein [Kutzneria buriramensis]|uniref:Phospholipid/cholesterol/gamma-HCH transport system substrate-binding protein n=1 Tax=Kutzneria buriramensis TaxID=1045776 RepID=A0A3E0GT56_9PSEU|nr:MCE family protein [Kutzneria buriramensis]REH26465.1 phospholipid/cholesterol/gamma-HCH transport system substrate-binding protein [Kutzneria buriramensis]